MSRGPDGAKREAWGRRLAEFSLAGLPLADFCQREGVSVASFYQWRRKLATNAAVQAAARSGGREAEPRQSPGGMQFLPIAAADITWVDRVATAEKVFYLWPTDHPQPEMFEPGNPGQNSPAYQQWLTDYDAARQARVAELAAVDDAWKTSLLQSRKTFIQSIGEAKVTRVSELGDAIETGIREIATADKTEVAAQKESWIAYATDSVAALNAYESAIDVADGSYTDAQNAADRDFEEGAGTARVELVRGTGNAATQFLGSVADAAGYYHIAEAEQDRDRFRAFADEMAPIPPNTSFMDAWPSFTPEQKQARYRAAEADARVTYAREMKEPARQYALDMGIAETDDHVNQEQANLARALAAIDNQNARESGGRAPTMAYNNRLRELRSAYVVWVATKDGTLDVAEAGAQLDYDVAAANARKQLAVGYGTAGSASAVRNLQPDIMLASDGHAYPLPLMSFSDLLSSVGDARSSLTGWEYYASLAGSGVEFNFDSVDPIRALATANADLTYATSIGAADNTWTTAVAGATQTWRTGLNVLEKDALVGRAGAAHTKADAMSALDATQFVADRAADMAYDKMRSGAISDRHVAEETAAVDWQKADYGAQDAAISQLAGEISTPWMLSRTTTAAARKQWYQSEAGPARITLAEQNAAAEATYEETVEAAFATWAQSAADARKANGLADSQARETQESADAVSQKEFSDVQAELEYTYQTSLATLRTNLNQAVAEVRRDHVGDTNSTIADDLVEELECAYAEDVHQAEQEYLQKIAAAKAKLDVELAQHEQDFVSANSQPAADFAQSTTLANLTYNAVESAAHEQRSESLAQHTADYKTAVAEEWETEIQATANGLPWTTLLIGIGQSDAVWSAVTATAELAWQTAVALANKAQELTQQNAAAALIGQNLANQQAQEEQTAQAGVANATQAGAQQTGNPPSPPVQGAPQPPPPGEPSNLVELSLPAVKMPAHWFRTAMIPVMDLNGEFTGELRAQSVPIALSDKNIWNELVRESKTRRYFARQLEIISNPDNYRAKPAPPTEKEILERNRFRLAKAELPKAEYKGNLITEYAYLRSVGKDPERQEAIRKELAELKANGIQPEFITKAWYITGIETFNDAQANTTSSAAAIGTKLDLVDTLLANGGKLLVDGQPVTNANQLKEWYKDTQEQLRREAISKKLGWMIDVDGLAVAASMEPLEREWNFWTKVLDVSGDVAIHPILDAAGMIPVVGEIFDAVNAALFAIRGKWLDATLSAGGVLAGFVGGSSIPIPAIRRALNLAARADELREVLKIAGNAAEAARTAGKVDDAAKLATKINEALADIKELEESATGLLSTFKGVGEPMEPLLFQRIKNAFEGSKKYPGFIDQSDEAISEMFVRTGGGAVAETLSAIDVTMILNPSRLTVFDEMLHVGQFRNGTAERVLAITGNKTTANAILEIQVQHKLINNRKAYKLTDEQVQFARERLEKLYLDFGEQLPK